MAIYFLVLLLSYLGGNVYIFIRGLQTIKSCPLVVKWLAGGLFWFSVFSLVLTFALRNSGIATTKVAHLFYEYSCSWLVFTLYMAILLLLCDAFRLFNHSFHYGFVIALVLTICVMLYGHYRYQHPVNRVFNIDINKPLANGTQTMKIVAVSDIHLGLGTDKQRMQKYVRLINAQHPDMILIAGDLIDNSISPVRRQRMEEELQQLEAPLGIYMSPGNHEYISGIDDAKEFLTSKTGIHLLCDSVVVLPNGLQIVGRDDHGNRSRTTLRELMERTDSKYPVFVLDHQPYELQQAADENVDLLLCGHTHNGQVWPMSLITGRMFDRSYGYEKRGNTSIYVSSGLSLWGPPYRIGTDSELVVLNLSFAHRP